MKTESARNAHCSVAGGYSQVAFLGVALLAVAAFAVVGLKAVQAFTEPSSTPPGGNVFGPVTISGDEQTKSGFLNVAGIDAEGTESTFSAGSYSDPHGGATYDAKFGGSNRGIGVRGDSYFAGEVGLGTTSNSASLLMDVEGQVGATEYCDENGDNCVDMASLVGASGEVFWVSDGDTFGGGFGEDIALKGENRDVRIYSYTDFVGTKGDFEIFRSRGTEASPTAVQDLDGLGALRIYGHDGTDFGYYAGMRFIVDGTVGTNDVPNRIDFVTSNTDLQGTSFNSFPTVLSLTSDQQVGIGTTDPSSKLHVYDGATGSKEMFHIETNGEPLVRISSAADNGWLNPHLSTQRSRGTLASPTAVQNGDFTFALWTAGYDGASYGPTSMINFRVDGGTGVGDTPGRIEFQTQPDGSSGNIENTTPELVIKNDGDVGIGDDTPDGALKLDVEGPVGATQFCDENGSNCFTAASVGGGGGGVTKIDDLSDGKSDDATTVFLGLNAGANDDGSANANTGVGINALNATTTGNSNTALGVNALTSNTTGNSNVAIGDEALENATTPSWNTAVGHEALRQTTTGASNTAVGAYSLDANTTGTSNIGVGYHALGANTTGGHNTAIGRSALSDNLTGQDNIAIGSYALLSNTTGINNVAIGVQSLNDSTTANNNTAVGTRSLQYNTTGSGNAAFGTQALRNNTTGLYNVAVGWNALRDNTTGYDNTAVGVGAFETNTTGLRNTAIGREALQKATASENTALGAYAGEEITTGANNVAVGARALDLTTTGANNVAVGRNALTNATIADSNVAVGARSLEGVTTGGDNTAIGFTAADEITDGIQNVAVGRSALGVMTSGDENIGIGYRAGEALTSGDKNIFIGDEVGDNLTSGSGNIIIGADIDAPVATGSNQLSIGNLIYGTGVDGTGTTLSTGSVGIGDNSPDATLKLDVEGQVGATEYCDENGANCFAATAIGSGLWENDTQAWAFKNSDTARHDARLYADSTAVETKPDFEMRRSRSGGAVASGDFIGGVRWVGHDGAGYKNPAAIYSEVTGSVSTNNIPNNLNFYIDSDNDPSAPHVSGLTPLFSLTHNQTAGIGDETPDGTLKLDVEGQVGATEYCDEDGNNCYAITALGAGAADGDAWGVTGEDQASNITRTGRVGIGASPSYPLHVNRTSSSFEVGYISTNVGGSNIRYVDSAGTPIEIGAQGGDAVIRTNSTARITAKTGTGFVGIGTGSPSQRLSVAGNMKLTGGVIYTDSANVTVRNDGGAWVNINASGANIGDFSSPAISYGDIGIGTYDFDVIDDSNNNLFRIENGGNVGIGDTTPQTKLEVRHATSGPDTASLTPATVRDLGLNVVDSSLDNVANKVSAGIALGYANESVTGLYSYDAGGSGASGLGFFSGNNAAVAERLRITETGSVGIGDQSPNGSLLLDVEGQVGATEYCDENGSNCVAAASLGSGATAIDDLTDGISSDSSSVFLGENAGANDDGTNNENTAVGISAMQANTTGSRNAAFGINALNSNTTGQYNKAFGRGALGANTTASHNVAMGNAALGANTTGPSNTAMGSQSMLANTTGGNNVAFGYATLDANTTGSNNTAVGHSSLTNTTTVSGNTAVGYNTLAANTTGINTAVGAYALDANTTASNNTAVGYSSLTANTTGLQNSALGQNSLASNTTGNYGTAVGYQALNANTTANYNTALGFRALDTNTTGTQNTGLGVNALGANTTGSYSTAVGVNALLNATGSHNTAVGQTALDSVTTGSNNVALGRLAGQNLTTGSNNIAVGYNIDLPSATGSNQMTIGNLIYGTGVDGTGTTVSSGNVGIGRNNPTSKLHVEGTTNLDGTVIFGDSQTNPETRLYFSKNADRNYFVPRLTDNSNWDWGAELGFNEANDTWYFDDTLSIGSNGQATSGTLKLDVEGQVGATEYCDENGANCQSITALAGAGSIDDLTDGASDLNSVFLGEGSGANDDGTANFNTGVGSYALQDVTSGSGNSGFGRYALGDVTIGHNNTGFGGHTLRLTTTGIQNTAVGRNALHDNITGSHSTAVGYNALNKNTASAVTAVGSFALDANTTGVSNTAVGYAALTENVTGTDNTGIGREALENSTTGSANTAVGRSALDANTTANNNTAIGRSALGLNTTGSQNTAVGAYTLDVATTASDNTGIGYGALSAATTGGENTAIGRNALIGLTTGHNNSALGQYAGDNITTGTRNIVIGADVDAPSATGSNQLTIGNLIYGTGVDGTGTTVSTGNVGIGVSNPAHRLEVSGNLKADESKVGEAYFSKSFSIGNFAANSTYTIGQLNFGSTFTKHFRVTVNGYWGTKIFDYYGYQTGLKRRVTSSEHASNYLENLDVAIELASGDVKIQLENDHSTAINYVTHVLVESFGGTKTDGSDWTDLASGSSISETAVNNMTEFAMNTSGDVGIGDTTPDGSLLLDVEGQVGATEYCDEDGNNCFTAGSVGGGASAIDDLTDGVSDGTSSVFLGTSAGANDDGSTNENVGLGVDALTANTTGFNNTAVGRSALAANTTGTNNAAIGYNALTANTTGGHNIAIGQNALATNTTASDNTAIGTQSLYLNTAGSQNVGVGPLTLRSNTSGNDNVAVGRGALYTNTTGSFNVGVGTDALVFNTTGASNVAMGRWALRVNSTGNYNVAVGNYALDANTTSSYNTALGENALTANTTGAANTALGYGALLVSTTGAVNNAVGADALRGVTTGSHNNALGYRAGDNITTGSRNIIIGSDIDAPSATTDGQISIGNLIYGTGATGTGTTVSTGNVGIGVSNPSDKLTVDGTTGAVDGLYIQDPSAPTYGARFMFSDANSKIFIGSRSAGTDINHLTLNRDDGNVGVGEISPNATFDVNGGIALAIKTVTANTTVTTADNMILCDASGGNRTMTLPAASGANGFEVTIKKIDSSNNDCVVDGNGSETIDDATTHTVAVQYQSITVMSDGTEWWIK